MPDLSLQYRRVRVVGGDAAVPSRSSLEAETELLRVRPQRNVPLAVPFEWGPSGGNTTVRCRFCNFATGGLVLVRGTTSLFVHRDLDECAARRARTARLQRKFEPVENTVVLQHRSL